MLKILPAKNISGDLRIPGDKSISHRALILSSFATGKSRFTGLSSGGDVRSTQRIMAQLGVEIKANVNKIQVTGVGNKGLKEAATVLNCGNSGTSARLLSGVLAGQNFFSVLNGDRSLRKRPMGRIVDPLEKMGAKIFGRRQNSKLPLAILGSQLHGIEYHSPIASAQVKTAILLAGIFAEGQTSVTEPAPSRDHTERLFLWLGLPFKKAGLTSTVSCAKIPNFSLDIPGDFSSAAYFVALGALHDKSKLTLRYVNLNETRIGFLKILQRMGANIKIDYLTFEPEPVGDIIIEPGELKNIKIEKSEIPSMIDELPLLAVVSTQAHGRLHLTGVQELRLKESDRITGIVSQLRKMGANIEELPDGFIVEGPTKLHGSHLEATADHRIVMSLTVAGLLAEKESTMTGESWVTISFPEFFEMIKQVVNY